ncbi:MAG: NgoFVII family restriction endonuclease [Sedimentisphaerales bacterium]|nr:NgoFVII family restriction endonuclease [Sedimentisphaerales bacterium]
MSYQIITNPTTEVFLEQVRNSHEQLFTCPFIKANIAKLILDNISTKSKTSLLTSYKLTNFYRGSSDLTALKSFIQKQVPVRNLPGLHAKTYIFDSDRAIITSANLTLGGLQNNYECGVLIEDDKTVSKLKSNFLAIFKDRERVSIVTEEIISVTEGILAKVPKEKKVKFEKSEKELFPQKIYEPEDDLYDAGVETITNTLSGWRLDVFNTVAKIPLNIFKLDSVYAFKKRLHELHPENLNVEAKIRQQLQELRDLGLVEFMGKGAYRKLWKNL